MRYAAPANRNQGFNVSVRCIKSRRPTASERSPVGSGCRWLSGKAARFTSHKADACSPSGWQAASGTRSWRLSLSKALPAGRYEVFSRAVTANGFREARFSRGDRNRVAFRVG